MYFPIYAYVKSSAPYWGHFCADFIFMCKVYKPCLKDAAYEFLLYLDYWFMRRRAFNAFPYITLCKMKHPLVGPFLGDFIFIFMCKFYKPCPKDALYQISDYLDCQFMRRRFFKIHKILPLFTPYWVPIGASPLIFANLNPHSLQMVPPKFG